MKSHAASRRLKILAVVCLLSSAILLALLFLPYPILKSFLDGAMTDGEFETLTPATALVIRLWFFLGAVLCIVLLGVSRSRESSRIKRDRTGPAGLHRVWMEIKPRRDDVPWLLGLGLVVAVGLAIRLPRLMAGLNHDEAYTVMVFGRSLAFALTNYHVPNNHILHTVLVFLTTSLLGPAPWAVRLPALVTGLAALVAIYFVGSAAYSRATGLGAAMLLAVASAHITYSVKARGYAPLALFTVLACWGAYCALRRRKAWPWVLLAVAAALGAMTIPLMVYPYAVLMSWLLAEGMLADSGGAYRTKAEFLRFWLGSGLMCALAVFALYTPALMVTGPEAMVAIGRVAPAWTRTFLDSLQANAWQVVKDWAGGRSSLLTLLAGCGLVLSVLLHRRLTWTKVPMQLVFLAVGSALVFVQRPNYGARIWFSFLPLAALWISAGTVGVVELLRIPGRRSFSLAAGILTVGLAVAGAYALGAVRTFPELWGRQGREEAVVLFLGKNLREGDWVVAPVLQVPVLRYYARVHRVSQQPFDREGEARRLLLIAYPGEGQSAEVLLERVGLAGAIDPRSAEVLTEFKGAQILEVQPPAP